MAIKHIFIMLGILLLIPMASAVCSVTFDKDTNYTQGETIVATMTCSEQTEKNTAYTLTWANASADTIETDTGTTPSVVDTNFLESFVIPSDYVAVNGTNITATLTGTDLEGSDWENVSSAGVNDLLITNPKITSASSILLSNSIGLKFDVKDENNKDISGAECVVSAQDGSNFPIIEQHGIISISGEGHSSFLLNSHAFDEATSYLFEIDCYCGVANTSSSCIDEDGNQISASSGTTSTTFEVGKWLTINTITDERTYNVLADLSVCANVTNNQTYRIPLEITYNWRCGTGLDSSTDRIVFGEHTEIRGISGNTTQMQCHHFTIPTDEENIERGGSRCYGATDVIALGDDGRHLVTYSSTSPEFNVTFASIHPTTKWIRIDRNTYNSNLTITQYDVDVKEVHAILEGDFIDTGMPITSLLDYTITYSNGSAIPYDTYLFTHQHSIKTDTIESEREVEIAIKGVNTTLDEEFNITITLHDFDNRTATALEGIENKTGTFHLQVVCPNEAVEGRDIECVITAYVEDSQQIEKETDFTCFIDYDNSEYSTLNFNKMVTREPFSITKSFRVPNLEISEATMTLQCYADYYNFGSRRDSFSDSFLAKEDGSNPKKIVDKFKEGFESAIDDIGDVITNPEHRNLLFFVVFFGGLIFLFLTGVIRRRRRIKDEEDDNMEFMKWQQR